MTISGGWRRARPFTHSRPVEGVRETSHAGDGEYDEPEPYIAFTALQSARLAGAGGASRSGGTGDGSRRDRYHTPARIVLPVLEPGRHPMAGVVRRTRQDMHPIPDTPRIMTHRPTKRDGDSFQTLRFAPGENVTFGFPRPLRGAPALPLWGRSRATSTAITADLSLRALRHRPGATRDQPAHHEHARRAPHRVLSFDHPRGGCGGGGPFRHRFQISPPNLMRVR